MTRVRSETQAGAHPVGQVRNDDDQGQGVSSGNGETRTDARSFWR